MFKWLFGKKKTQTKATQEVKVTGKHNTVVQSASVEKPKYYNYVTDSYVYGFSANDPYSQLSDPVKPKRTSASNNSNSYDSYNSPSYTTASSYYDSGSSSCDSGSSSFSSCD